MHYLLFDLLHWQREVPLKLQVSRLAINKPVSLLHELLKPAVGRLGSI